MKDKILNFIKNNALLSCVICAFVVALITSIIVAAIMMPDSGTGENSDALNGESETALRRINWGDGITKDIPRFSVEPELVEATSESAAAYYMGVTSEQIAEYVALLERELGIEFSSDKYPRSAVWGDKIIAIHYNVTEMNFSVTVAKASD